MSNPDLETPKPKRKNVDMVRRRRWRIVLISLNALMLLLLVAILNSREIILTGSTQPEVDSVDYWREYIDGEVKVHMTIHYHDAEGDISTLTIEYFRYQSNFGTISERPVSTRPSVQRRGAVLNTWFICDSYGTNITIYLNDQQGNESNHFRELVQCYPVEDSDRIPVIQTLRAARD